MDPTMIITAGLAAIVGILIGRYSRKAIPVIRPIIPNVSNVFLVDPAGNAWFQR